MFPHKSCRRIRLLHHCEVVSINGNSYRPKNKLFAIDGGVASA
ncbi:ATP-binding protein [Streptomyces sp. NPDC007325]